MRGSPDGNTRFARQENGQVFADGNEQKIGLFSENGGRYMKAPVPRPT
ncbi:hypothetical protein HMPREF0262_01978, partial [Clostridium sp. ATCC 29733]